MSIAIKFQKNLKNKADTVICSIYKGNKLSESAENLDKEHGKLISHHLKNQKKFTGKQGQTLALSPGKNSDFSHLILVGLGDPAELDALACEKAGGALSQTLSSVGADKAVFMTDNKADKKAKLNPAVIAAHIALGVHLRSYNFKKYKTKKSDKDKKDNDTQSLTIAGSASDKAQKAYKHLGAAAAGIFTARDLVNEPPNKLYPASFVSIIKKELSPLGVKIEVFDEKKMKQLGFHAALNVGMGSARPPRIVVMRWNGGTKKTDSKKKPPQPLAFIGKGITFDTGGINIKPSSGLASMKMDMGGAATVTGLMKTLALRKSKAHVVGIVGLAENMPSDRAYRPSDVIDSLSGQTIEVMNTDAEGRLVLADCISYIQKKYKPRFMVDLATLTGAMLVALGQEYCGTFVNDDKLWSHLEQASEKSGEKLWRMPLDENFRKEMDSTIADIKSLGNGRNAGACTAAAFLQRFVENDCPWAHLDIAGTAWISSHNPTCPKPATGFGVRVLDQMVSSHYEP